MEFKKITDRYEGALDPWMSSLWKMLYQKNHSLLPNAATPDAILIYQPKIQIIYHDTEEGLPSVATKTGFKLFTFSNYVSVVYFSLFNVSIDLVFSMLFLFHILTKNMYMIYLKEC